MEKEELLRAVGFSQEFITRLQQYESQVVEIPNIDFLPEETEYIIVDSTNILLQKTTSSAETNFIVAKDRHSSAS